MKNIILLFFFLTSSMLIAQKKKTITPAKAANATGIGLENYTPKKDIHLKKTVNKIPSKLLPIIDKTNFDSFIEAEDYKKVPVKKLQLTSIYPNFYTTGYNYRAIAVYKINLSNTFYSIVVTVLKGENEMETRLINYTLQGKIIDSIIVAYDEIAEGIYRTESEIKQTTISINNITWAETKEVETKLYNITSEGSFTSISPKKQRIQSVIKQLGLDTNQIKKEFIVSKVQPHNSEEAIVVIPEIYGEDDEHMFRLNSHIVLVNTSTNKITHKYFESATTNGWESDAILLSEISIDTAPYILNKNTRAFGIRLFHYGMSKPNPYSNRTISLFVKSGKTLKKILHHYPTLLHNGEWDTTCAGNFTTQKNTLIMSAKKTNGYSNIIVKSKITNNNTYVTTNGNCDEKEKTTHKTTVLQFNGKTYITNSCNFTPLRVYLKNTTNKAYIYNKPNGKKIRTLNTQNDYFMLQVSKTSDGWFKVIKIEGIEQGNITIPGGFGWINATFLEASTTKEVTLFDSPYGYRKAIGTIKSEIQVNIKNSCSGWVKISYNGIQGWVPKKWLCGNPVTTCP